MKQSPSRGYALAILFLLVGVGSVAEWLYGGRVEVHELLKGVGFMLMAPDAHLNPINLRSPLRAFLQPQRSATANRPAQYIAMAGFALVIAGLVAWWL